MNVANIAWHEKNTSFNCTGFKLRGNRWEYSSCKNEKENQQNIDKNAPSLSNSSEMQAHIACSRWIRIIPVSLVRSTVPHWIWHTIQIQQHLVIWNRNSAQRRSFAGNLCRFVDKMILTTQQNSTNQSPTKCWSAPMSTRRPLECTHHLCCKWTFKCYSYLELNVH